MKKTRNQKPKTKLPKKQKNKNQKKKQKQKKKKKKKTVDWNPVLLKSCGFLVFWCIGFLVFFWFLVYCVEPTAVWVCTTLDLILYYTKNQKTKKKTKPNKKKKMTGIQFSSKVVFFCCFLGFLVFWYFGFLVFWCFVLLFFFCFLFFWFLVYCVEPTAVWVCTTLGLTLYYTKNQKPKKKKKKTFDWNPVLLKNFGFLVFWYFGFLVVLFFGILFFGFFLCSGIRIYSSLSHHLHLV